MCAIAETPEEWFDDYAAHIEKIEQRQIAFVESRLHGDTTYRKLTEQSHSGQMPMLRYLLRYYLMKDPDQLVWDRYGPFMQVMPCECGEEGSIDSAAFRVLFPPYARASSAWDDIDSKLQQKYSNLKFTMYKDKDLTEAEVAELSDLRVRFERLKAAFKKRKEANQALLPTSMSVTIPADAGLAPAILAADL